MFHLFQALFFIIFFITSCVLTISGSKGEWEIILFTGLISLSVACSLDMSIDGIIEGIKKWKMGM